MSLIEYLYSSMDSMYKTEFLGKSYRYFDNKVICQSMLIID